MKLRDATQQDLTTVAGRSVSRGCFGEMPTVIDYVYALEHDGELLGVGGIKMMNATTAWAWVDMTDLALKHKIVAYQTIRDWMDRLVKLNGIRRLMAAVDTEFEEGIRMAEHLGFERESLMLKWSGDKPAHMYVRIT